MPGNARRRTFGFLDPQPYMLSAMEELGKFHNIRVLRPGSWDPEEIAELVTACKAAGVESVGGFAQKDALHHALINAGLGNPAPSRLAMLHGMNKYLMRTLELDPFFFAPVDPLTETDEQIRAKIPDCEWPFMLKNTSLSLGRGIFRIYDFKQLRQVLDSYRHDRDLQELIARQNRGILEGVDPSGVPPLVPPFLAEHLEVADGSIEYCYEGYVTPEGRVVHYGITEEVYFHDHQGVGYVIPPVSIGASIAPKIEAWVAAYMAGFVKLGYVNQFFNLEFWIRKDGSIKLTEINPRSAHTFHYSYSLSCGASLYGDNFLLAAGDRVPSPTPFEVWKLAGEKMRHTMIALFTLSEPGRVADQLDFDYVDQLERVEGLLVRRTRCPDEVLRPADMTSSGVMAVQVWLTGDSKDALVAREAEIRGRIYRKRRSFSYPDYWRLSTVSSLDGPDILQLPNCGPALCGLE